MSKMILIVDDEPSIRRLSRRLLERMGFSVLEAETGENGLLTFQSHLDQIHTVLLDLHLPDGTGKEFAGRFRELKPDLPIIYFTGSNLQQSEESSGARDFVLKKPFTPDSMKERVQQALPADS